MLNKLIMSTSMEIVYCGVVCQQVMSLTELILFNCRQRLWQFVHTRAARCQGAKIAGNPVWADTGDWCIMHRGTISS